MLLDSQSLRFESDIDVLEGIRGPLLGSPGIKSSHLPPQSPLSSKAYLVCFIRGLGPDSAKFEFEVEVTACAVLAAEVDISLIKKVEADGHVVGFLASKASPPCGCDGETCRSKRKSIMHVVGLRPNPLVIEFTSASNFVLVQPRSSVPI